MTADPIIMRKRPACNDRSTPGRWMIYIFVVVSGTSCGLISTSPVVQAWAPISTFGASSLRSSNTARFLIIEEHDTYFNRRDDDDDDDAHLFGASELTNITMTAQRTWKLAQAQKKIDAILNSPIDPPFDSEAEWKKVLSVSTPSLSAAEWELEDTTSRLEAELNQAVKASDFAKAANHSSSLATLSLEDGALVLQANARFYQAFSEKNIEDMRSVWLSEVNDGDEDASCICIHPSHPPIVGTQAIVKSWSQMFGAGSASRASSALGESRINPHNIRLSVKATTAIVTCEEHVTKGDDEEEGDPQKRLQATNIFRKVKGQWFMTHHHAAYHAESATVKAALQEKWNHKRGVDTSKAKSSKKGFQKPPPLPEMSILDKIVGMPEFGPVLGDKKGGPNDEDGDGNKPVKRIIMGGSLSDLLNGGLFDMTGDEEDEDDAEETIIEEDVEDDGDDSAEDKAMLLNIQNMARRDTQRKLQRQANLGGKSSTSDSEGKKDIILREDQEEQARRRTGTLKLLRELVHQGRLSSNHKRLLLTDIIHCKANGEQSMVEVAYDLLYRSSVDDEEDEGEEDEDALEEFADQCLALARSLEMEENDPLHSQ